MIWDSVNDPVGIGEAVFPGWLRLLVSGFEGQRFPVSVEGNVQAKAWRVFDAFQQLNLAYDWEPPESHPGKQKIRPLNEVISQRRGTCVDLCTAFACAALDARLHPLILIVKKPRARHAIVLIPVDKSWEGGCPPVIQAPYFTDTPKDLDGSNRHLLTAQEPGDLSANWLAIDVQQATERQATWSQALEFGASYADPNGQWEWDVCIDVGAIAAQRGPDANVPSVLKAADALAPAFTALPDAPSPLQLLSPLYGVVPYCKNTHYTALREWILPPPIF
ncbi:hypothetical protein [Buchananella felis]|uniref:hypothetical protein n=1 Tax=Buchananella felis TaxID=3231492 RepID=UPI003529093A